MLIRGFPVNSGLAVDTQGGARFWYWRGASGRKYIHSVYRLDSCPPVPGAIYVAVKWIGGERCAISAGRFSSYWDGSMGGLARAALSNVDADEVHVHLLAGNNAAAENVLSDLVNAFPRPRTEAKSVGLVDLTMRRAA
jgi:hypothetical protein